LSYFGLQSPSSHLNLCITEIYDIYSANLSPIVKNNQKKYVKKIKKFLSKN